MREIADAERIRRFMRVFGAAAPVPTRVYFTGGATAVLLGWRASTIDVGPDRRGGRVAVLHQHRARAVSLSCP